MRGKEGGTGSGIGEDGKEAQRVSSLFLRVQSSQGDTMLNQEHTGRHIGSAAHG